MFKFVNHKLFEIFFDKALIALVILFIGHVANQSIERFKLVEAQRVIGTTAFVDACQEIWPKLYEYESEMGKSEDYAIRRKFASLAGDKDVENEVEIANHKRRSDELLRQVSSTINAKRFIIGQELTVHFFKYAGLVKARADARSGMFAKSTTNAEVKIDQDAVEAFDKLIVSMRFTADMAREYSISRLPQ